jgi:putative heme-binding domain-containing protein
MPTMTGKVASVLALALLAGSVLLVSAQKPAHTTVRPPHGQDHLPGPALTPAQAIKKMKVPPGFSVEVVASEPDIVNPVAMTFDERGRIWITESLEYPRSSAGPGRDRIKVLEDTDGDGKVDKVTVFAEGLNIPSGIAVGHGGVWVANSPDILFYRIGPDGKAAGKPEVVVTGFGRTDTHELPNSLTWGPDGWLYGLNGVFNHSHVKHRGKDYRFTCALFRIHPKTREFQLFCEGTSNPWGLAFDTQGSAFVSACVIDHLWHLTETGYYHRQGGPYPPFTWPLGSIVKHRHQKAAYCGLHFFDSDAYPKEYRERLYMGNIHGGCVNVDVLKRAGSTYFATPDPDFLSANDAWFMPVAQKTGPDGCLYILDWYDRYHCYQDARRDPKGIDRLNGRLYRVRYKNTPRAAKFDLGKESDDRLIERLHSPNVYFRDVAQRLLCERNDPATRGKLRKVIFDAKEPRKARLHALWALVGMGSPEASFLRALLEHADPTYRAWGVRAAGNAGKVEENVRAKVVALAKDSSPDVLLQVAIASRKIAGVEPLAVLLEVLGNCGDDRLIPVIVWQNLHPLLEGQAEPFVAAVKKRPGRANLGKVLPRAAERLLARRKFEPRLLLGLVEALATAKKPDLTSAAWCLGALEQRLESGEIAGARAEKLRAAFGPLLRRLMASRSGGPLRLEALLVAATLADPEGLMGARALLKARGARPLDRLRALQALIAVGDKGVLETAAPMLSDRKDLALSFRERLLGALGRLEGPEVGRVVLAAFPKMEAPMQARAVELLSQRVAWGKALVRAVAERRVPAGLVNANQLRRLLASKDAKLVKQARAIWGTVRSGRNPERERVVAQMRSLLKRTRGDAKRGRVVFKNLCGQCHKIYGEGEEVGPDITSNGRASFEQLLSNVFDPSLVIGPGYQAVTVVTAKGRSLTGLLVEDSPMRVVLKLQGGKQEVVPRKQVEKVTVSNTSLMPEGVEKQLKPQEIADLFAFLTLDRPPDDPKAKKIPGTLR